MSDNPKRHLSLCSIGAEIQQVVVINDGEFQVPQPALPAKQVTRQVRVFGEIDKALKSDIARLQRDFVTEGIKRTSQPAQSGWDALLDRNSKVKAIFVTKKTDGRSGVHFGCDFNTGSPISQHDQDGDAINIVLVAVFFIKIEVFHSLQMPIGSGSSGDAMR